MSLGVRAWSSEGQQLDGGAVATTDPLRTTH